MPAEAGSQSGRHSAYTPGSPAFALRHSHISDRSPGRRPTRALSRTRREYPVSKIADWQITVYMRFKQPLIQAVCVQSLARSMRQGVLRLF